ncbi:uncharacterized protein LOC110689688 isoform X1 [Chenopodium quinoa]|uniref:uncharacterized protein LOC110689688 isoform X1 n=1 Tax=Chenopodium quinoa TaxID=63459 RepID=UPI000B76E4B9|nr:uncharacterized protein LOC110689688 isoform X1 [Chenopodium quinoa]
MDRNLILELSSDEEVGFDNSSTADNFDWITKLLEDDDPVSIGGIFNLGDGIDSGGGGGGGGDKVVVDDDDDVVVVGEVIVQKPKKAKTLMPRIDDDDDDDCVVLEGDPDKPKDEVKESEEDSDDLLIVGETGQVACRDYPHPRHLCAKFPFSSSSHESRCEMCHCYVCDSLAPCSLWGSGASSSDHCHATDKEEFWKLARKKFRQLKNPSPPIPITKPGFGSLNQLPQLQQIPSGTNSLVNPTSACGVPSTFGLPNIIRSQRSSIAVASNRFQPHLISGGLLRNCTSNTQVQGNRVVASRAMFKRSGLTSRPVVTNRPAYRAPKNVSVAYLQHLPNQQLTENLAENNSTNSTVSSLHLDVNPSFCLPSSISPGTSPLQLQGYSQPSPHTPTSHFHGGHSAAIASNGPFAYTSLNQTQNVSGLVLPCNTDAQSNITLCSEIQSAVTQTISGPNLSCSTPDVLSSITQRSHPSAEQSYSGPMLSCSASNALNTVSKSCQLPAAENFVVQGGVPVNEYLPTIERNVLDNTESIEFDFENWDHDGSDILGSQDSFLLDMNNQASVPAPVDAGMLYFDFETSWKGLARS